MEKLLIITPHMSTGGCPQFVLKRIELLKDCYDIWCVEYDFLSPDYVVQRNKVIQLIGDKFISLGDKKDNLINIIDGVKPDIILIEDFSETFIDLDICKSIFTNDRKYKIIETTHSSNDFNKLKRFLPDKFIFVSEFSRRMYERLNVESVVIEYPIDKKDKRRNDAISKLKLDPNSIHVLNIGLFTPGKNQGYAFDIAREFLGKNVTFHFIGNRAGNFKNYWEPLMKDIPSNCILWGERSDVDDFINASDLFLFTSKFELNPLVIKEVLCYDIPILMFNLETYCGSYNNEKSISFLTGELNTDVNILVDIIGLDINDGHYDFIEIGTSDFDTLIESAKNLTRGISIEPIKYYIDRLPNKRYVKKIQSALSDSDGEIKIYYIPNESIEEYKLPYWIRGCNSVNRPHQFTISKIGKDLYDQLVKIDSVSKISWKTLIDDYSIKTIGFLKIDTEGHEYTILNEYFKICKENPNLYADKIKFEYNENSDKIEISKLLRQLKNYTVEYLDDDIILSKKKNLKEGYVLYSNEKYFEIVSLAAKSIREFSNLPIYVYMLNSDLKINIKNVYTIRWNCSLDNDHDMYLTNNSNFYINRNNLNIYKLLAQRPLIVKDVLQKYLDVVAYVDSDSIATPSVDNIFNFYKDTDYPYFVEGIYDYLFANGRGGAETKEDLTNTLEHPACELFSVNQKIREKYRQTGYFVSSKRCIDFLDEWHWMCINPTVMKNNDYYAPYNEETILNVLLWKKGILDGLPYLYINGNLDNIEEIYEKIGNITNQIGTRGDEISQWTILPMSKDMLMFFHGEKNIEKIEKMLEKIKILHKYE